ncbi:methionyl-tRNA formyltransferase [Holzapfeliella sp. He02]|uniref:Methionyl-tRNA formyltransferase n=1 Tax=Holzapfeliella saturejae TaxID=3082953 RepID=A0ABU8SGS1_9LACO
MKTIIFMGTPQFSVPILKGIYESGDYEIKAVVTQPDKKLGRKRQLTPTPVKAYATEVGLPVLQPEKLSQSEELAELIDLKADFIVTAAYGQFLPTSFLNSVKIAAVNVHGSLLPHYRGGAPIQYALKNGDEKTGVTIMEMVKEMDAGDMYSQEAITIADDDNAATIFDKLSYLGRDLLLKTLPQIAVNPTDKMPQNPEDVSFSPTISKEEAQVATTLTAKEAHDLIRALNPNPGAYLYINGVRTKLWQSHVLDEKTTYKSGVLVDNYKRFCLSFADNSVLEIDEIQPMGKPRMKISDYLNGHGRNLKIGEKVVSDEE